MPLSRIEKTEHYMKKKGDRIEIESKDYYVLCKLENQTLWVINAKRR